MRAIPGWIPVVLALVFCLPCREGKAGEKRTPIFPQGKDLGANPTFEKGEGKRPAGWFVHQPPLGMKVEWGEFGVAGTKGLRFTPPKNATPETSPGAANQVLREFESGKTIEVTAWFRLTGFRGLCIVWARCDGPKGTENREEAFQNSIGAGYILEGTTIWSPVTVRVTPGKKTRSVIFGVVVGGTGTVEVDEIHARVRKGPSPLPETGPGLYLAEGRYRALVSKDTDRLKVHVPVPMLWRDQIPLSFRAWTDPGVHLASVKFLRRTHGFHVAEIELKDMKKGAKVFFRWEAQVLALPHEPTPLPKGIELPLKNVPVNVAPWLRSTWCCDAKHASIRALAEEIRKGASTADLLIPVTLKRMQKIFHGAKGRVTNLTAVEAVTKRGSCTSCANLGAALLRAHGIPARILAGYPTWSGPLQTHYVVEYWLPKGGWRLMESTRCVDDRPAWEQIEVAMVLPEDESEAKAKRRIGAAGAVPYLSLTEYPEIRDGRSAPVYLVGDMPEREGCDHRAVRLALFDATAAEWTLARKRLSSRWRKMTGKALASSKPVLHLAPVEGLASVKTLEDLLKALKDDEGF